jgi:chemotaxis protein MotB
VSITGHTDTTSYAGITGYTNWDLSTDRANAARRTLEESGLPTERISRVVGLASNVLFDRANPRGAINRRISIVVMTKQAEEEANKTDLPATQRAVGMSGVIQSAPPVAQAETPLVPSPARPNL